MLHTKVDVIALLRSIDEKIFQRIVAVSCGERLLTYLAIKKEQEVPTLHARE
jgi:hypothetical protein